MQSSEDVKLPFLGGDTKQREQDSSEKEKKSKPKVRFLVGSEFRTAVVPEPLATAIQHKIETNSDNTNNKPKLSHATLQDETQLSSVLRLEHQAPPKPRQSTHDNMATQTLLRHAQEVIQQKNENLRLLVKEQDGLRNEVAVADHTIMELKTRLTEANYSLGNTRVYEQSLRLEVGKLKHEREKLKKRCENASWETASRLRAKDENINGVQAETNKTLKLCDEVTIRNQGLRERLEKRDKVAFGLKTKFALMSNWTVR